MDETNTLREAYAALNRNDIPAMIAAFDPQIEWTDPPPGGTYRGHAEVLAHFTQARATWAEGSCTPERFVVAGDRVVVFVHVRVRLKNSKDWIEADLGDVFTFKDGKVVHFRSFIDRQEAVDWAGANVEAT